MSKKLQQQMPVNTYGLGLPVSAEQIAVHNSFVNGGTYDFSVLLYYVLFKCYGITILLYM